MRTVSETAALLRSFDNVLILTHVRPDGDTAGCAAALAALLRDPARMQQLSENCAKRDYTNSAEVEKIYALMED